MKCVQLSVSEKKRACKRQYTIIASECPFKYGVQYIPIYLFDVDVVDDDVKRCEG